MKTLKQLSLFLEFYWMILLRYQGVLTPINEFKC